jgi:hypothetical protein
MDTPTGTPELIKFDLDTIGNLLDRLKFSWNKDAEHDRINIPLPGENGDLHLHLSVGQDGENHPVLLRFLSYSPGYSAMKEGVPEHALLHYLNHKNVAAVLGRHFCDERTGVVAFELAVYSAYGIFENDLTDLMWFAANEADQTLAQTKALALRAAADA